VCKFYDVTKSANNKNGIDKIELEKKELLNKIDSQNKKIDSFKNVDNKIDDSIKVIFKNNEVIKNKYHEKIVFVDTFSVSDLNRFFAERYD
jgi:hypothetical protein